MGEGVGDLVRDSDNIYYFNHHDRFQPPLIKGMINWIWIRKWKCEEQDIHEEMKEKVEIWFVSLENEDNFEGRRQSL